jgi:hypothetical protein
MHFEKHMKKMSLEITIVAFRRGRSEIIGRKK